MSFASVEYLLALFLFASIFFQLSNRWLKQLAFGIASAGFYYSHTADFRSHITLLVLLSSGFACAKLLQIRPSRLVLALYLVALVAVFAVLKKYDLVKLALPARLLEINLEMVGLSYILFRQIHFLVDMMQGQIERATLLAYLNYQLNPFTLLAGPIQRFQDFQAYWENPVPLFADRHEYLKACLRVCVGIIKIVVIGTVFHTGYEIMFRRIGGSSPIAESGWKSLGTFALLMYCYTLYLYINFSGYCDAAIGSASLVGLRLPENFNHPFTSRNMIVYWTRWHITLGQWIRDYLFTPLYKAGVERMPRHAQALAVLSYFVAFTLAGIWHGTTLNFLVFGLLQGLGVSSAKLWENTIIAFGGRPRLRSYLKSAPIRVLAIAMTFHYTCFALVFFAHDLGQTLRILRNVAQPFKIGY
jgi:D-alanyl-lipoteichoic acid acyltransferase DltB (MBOAT superfamily)